MESFSTGTRNGIFSYVQGAPNGIHWKRDTIIYGTLCKRDTQWISLYKGHAMESFVEGTPNGMSDATPA